MSNLLKILIILLLIFSTVFSCHILLTDKIYEPKTDTSAPSPGASIYLGLTSFSTAIVSWDRASDDMTDQSELQYKLVKSTSLTDIDTIQEIQNITGPDLLMDWSENTSINLTGLTYGNTYNFNVLVKDLVGHLAIYTPKSLIFSVNSQILDSISFAFKTSHSATVNWTLITEDRPAGSGMEYKLARSTNSADIDTIAKVESMSGQGVVIDWTENINTAFSDGMNGSSDYYYSMVIRDGAGNKLLYNPKMVSTFPSGTIWYCATDNAPWGLRSAHTSVVFQEKIWIIGGKVEINELKNDVWSSNDGVNWTCANSNAQWHPRRNHTSAVFDNKIWLIAGSGVTEFSKDVWYSSDGINWFFASSVSTYGWKVDIRHATVVYNSKLWISGGKGAWTSWNDVWSSNNGYNWIKISANAQWSPRNDHAFVVYNNYMWLLGGRDINEFDLNDVWYSNDGQYWTCTVSSAPWSARSGIESFVLNNRIYIMNGGKNDGWSTPDGINWIEDTYDANRNTVYNRNENTCVVFKNFRWVIGGSNKNDVWYSE